MMKQANRVVFGVLTAIATGATLTAIHFATSARASTPPAKPACETVQMEVRVPGGMPASYILTFCGQGIPATTLICPRNSDKIPGNWEKMTCRITG